MGPGLTTPNMLGLRIPKRVTAAISTSTPKSHAGRTRRFNVEALREGESCLHHSRTQDPQEPLPPLY